MPSSNSAKLRNLFGIDLRSLALFRILIGILLLADLAIRSSDLNAMYSDAGMFPRSHICSRATPVWHWSFHFASGSGWFQAIVFGVAAFLAIGLIVGYKTRVMQIGSWLFLVSLQHRVPPILSGADILLRLLLFWAMFLPLGAVWSLDSRKPGHPVNRCHRGPVLSLATLAILLQMALMYFFSAIFKSNSEWLQGDVIKAALQHGFYGSRAGSYIADFPGILRALTRTALALEWIAPFLLFLPRFTAGVRMGVLAALALMHLGIWLLLEVDFFSPVALAGLTLFLPPKFWELRLPRGVKLAEADLITVSDSPPVPSLSPPFQAACAILFLYVLAVNMNSLPMRPLRALAPEKWRPLSTGLALDQRWAMFTGAPSNDGWYVGRAKLASGLEIDLLRAGRPIDWRRPDFPARIYPNHRWRKLFREMAYADQAGFQLFRVPVSRYLCRRWNEAKPADPIANFELIYCRSGEEMIDGIRRIFREKLARVESDDPFE